MITMGTFFYGWIILHLLELAVVGLAYVGWVILVGFLAYVVGIRVAVRQKHGIPGSIFQDSLISLMYPLAVDQMDREMMFERGKKDDGDDVNMADLGKDAEKEQFLQKLDE